MDRSEKTDHPTIKPYDDPSGGWGSVKSLVSHATAQDLLTSTLWATLQRQNKPDGYQCVSCSWAKPADPRPFEYCENGAKATIWEITPKRCDRDFFAKHTVTELREWTDHDLEKQGRLTTPMRYDASLDQYIPVKWEDAFREIGAELNKLDPKSVVFYVSGRASLEASHMWQLMARIYGSNNLPDSSNMCHESTSVGLPESIGSPVGTVTLDDFDTCDMMFFFGHNTGTNAPRLLHWVQGARKRGAPVITFNPVLERGLMRFKNPQNPVEMLSPDEGTKMSSDYYQLRGGGDIAAMTGIAKGVFALDDAAREAGRKRVLDVAFIEENCHGFEDFEAYVRSADWGEIERCSGLSRAELEHVARVYANAEKVIANYGMGLTQHRHGIENVQMLVNLLLMRGMMGKTGAGISPIRGHSNVQGQRTVGITEKLKLIPVDKFEKFYDFTIPKEDGVNTVEACEGILDGSIRGFVSLGGNFSRAVPDTGRIEEAWRRMRLSVQISTKLNRNHLLPGAVTYILPCLGRIERDVQKGAEQVVSMEDFNRLRPRVLWQARARLQGASLRAADRRRTRQGDHRRQVERAVGRVGRRLRQGPRRDRACLSRRLQGVQPAFRDARRLPPRHRRLQARVAHRDRQGELQGAGDLRRRSGYRYAAAGRAPADHLAFQRPVQHDDLRLQRPPARRRRHADGDPDERGGHAPAGPDRPRPGGRRDLRRRRHHAEGRELPRPRLAAAEGQLRRLLSGAERTGAALAPFAACPCAGGEVGAGAADQAGRRLRRAAGR